MLLRLPYLALTSVFTLIRLTPMTDSDKNVEILALRHQLAILQRQIDKPRLTPPDRAFLATLLHRLPGPKLRQLHLIVSPDTVLRWHRDLLRRHHAKQSRPKQPGRPPTIRSIQTLVLRLAREHPSWATGESTANWPASASRSPPSRRLDRELRTRIHLRGHGRGGRHDRRAAPARHVATRLVAAGYAGRHQPSPRRRRTR
ncbi:hypothetical protein ACPPVO_22915 [Dactylosporangium sp. McL0621]|uniref:hypothetical protein n=1 Tax=Dactylosporangium sp. McL0621 TaxID=3415678 RepID=UPI003CEE741F